MDDIDIDIKLTDCHLFDGASNVQTAGAILCALYPHALCFHGGKHVLSLFLATSPNSNPHRLVLYFLFIIFNFFFQHNFQLLVIKCCRRYIIFGYGASQGNYAQFIAQAIKLGSFVVQKPYLQHGSMPCTKLYVRSQHCRQPFTIYPLKSFKK